MASMLGGPHFGHPPSGPSFMGHPHLGPQGPPHPQLAPGMRYPFPGGPAGIHGGPSGPEDMNRAHALEMLQHQANQYYAAMAGPPPPPPPPPHPPGGQQPSGGSQPPSHKIHELAERAMKSPTSSPAVSLTQGLYGKSETRLG